jgi:hypothetical protein
MTARVINSEGIVEVMFSDNTDAGIRTPDSDVNTHTHTHKPTQHGLPI